MPTGSKEDFQERREKWIEHLDWFLANFILCAYEDWHGKADDTEKLNQIYIPSSFNAKRDGTKSKPKLYTFWFFQHMAEYDPRKENGPVKFFKFRADSNEGLVKNKPDIRYATLSFRFYYATIPIKLRVELYEEYVSLSFAAQLDIYDQSRRDERCGDVCVELDRRFKRALDATESRWRTCAPETRKETNEWLRSCLESMKSDTEFLYRKFWEDVDKAFIKPALTPVLSPPWHKGFPSRNGKYRDRSGNAVSALTEIHLGKRIVDFRGLILSYDPKEVASDPKPDVVGRQFHRPFTAPYRNLSIAPPPMGSGDDLHSLVLASSPIMEGGSRALARASENDPRKMREQPLRHEYAVSLVDNKHALFVTTLAPQLVWNEVQAPGAYIVITNHRDRWQIGRLVDRLHTLGTLRVASLWNFEQLDRAHKKLREITREIDGIDHKPVREVVRALNKKFRKSSLDVSDGGLAFRTSHALTYIEQFEAECKALVIESLDTYQAYDALVRRRVGGNWSFIRDLARRHERVRYELNLLNNELRAEEELGQTTKLAELLSTAELVASVPVVYYGSYLLSNLVGEVSIWTSLYSCFADTILRPLGANLQINEPAVAIKEKWPLFAFALFLYFFGLKVALKVVRFSLPRIKAAWRALVKQRRHSELAEAQEVKGAKRETLSDHFHDEQAAA